jgi:hypothetical protein
MIESKRESVKAVVAVNDGLLGRLHVQFVEWFGADKVQCEFKTSDGVTHSSDSIEQVIGYPNPPKKAIRLLSLHGSKYESHGVQSARIEFDQRCGYPRIEVSSASNLLHSCLETLRDEIKGSPGSLAPLSKAAVFIDKIDFYAGLVMVALAIFIVFGKGRVNHLYGAKIYTALFLAIAFILVIVGSIAAKRTLAPIQFELGAGKNRAADRNTMAVLFASLLFNNQHRSGVDFARRMGLEADQRHSMTEAN